ncbi:MAG: hypothetical protein AB7D51_00125 [Desulfovibrionaceae bacterium]
MTRLAPPRFLRSRLDAGLPVLLAPCALRLPRRAPLRRASGILNSRLRSRNRSLGGQFGSHSGARPLPTSRGARLQASLQGFHAQGRHAR